MSEHDWQPHGYGHNGANEKCSVCGQVVWGGAAVPIRACKPPHHLTKKELAKAIKRFPTLRAETEADPKRLTLLRGFAGVVADTLKERA